MSEPRNNPLNVEDENTDPLVPARETESAPENENPAAKIIELQGQLDKAKDQTLRALAEAENARKRALKERDDASKYAIAGFAKNLLSVADNLGRALEAVPADALAVEPRLKNLVDGIEATRREMAKAFEQSGIRQLDPLDELFNPNFHEVMFEAPGTGKRPGTVIQVVETGYLLHDRLLRPARVGVAKDEGQGPGENGGTPGANLDTEA